MDLGLFHAPYNRLERTARQTFDWAYEHAVRGDCLGYGQMMIGEHATQGWECIPNPELVIAAAARDTERIRLAPMAHALPFRQPATLAIMVGWLSQILEGRYFLGVGTGGYANDALLRGLAADPVANEERLVESIEIMRRVWRREPFSFHGRFWDAGFPEPQGSEAPEDQQNVLKDYTPVNGEPEIVVVGFAREPASFRLAGASGWAPFSISTLADVVRTHWPTYEAAATVTGREPSRSSYRVSQTLLVADSDVQARRMAIEGGIGKAFRHYLWPIWKRFGVLDQFALEHGGQSASEIDLEWICDNVWVVGSPETVEAKLAERWEACGGWGTLVIETHDYMDDPDRWFESLERVAAEIAPRIEGWA